MYPAPKNLFVTPVVPYAADGSVDEGEYRSLLRRFLDERYVEKGMALIANPEAGEIFYLDREEKRRVVEIAVDEAAGRVPVYAGAIDTTTAGTVQTAKDAAEAGAVGIFVMPAIGAMDVSTSWDASSYPEVFIDMLHAITAEVDLPMLVHPTAAPTGRYGVGIPTDAARTIIEAVPHIVGWKMTYNYDGYREVSRMIRGLGREVSILGAPAHYFHENLAAGAFDGTVNGSWNFGLETMFAHVQAWREGDSREATRIWEGGLAQLQEYVYSEYSRLHVRYKTATWLRGWISSPLMRPPLPRPRPEEVRTLAGLLQGASLSVRSAQEIDAYLAVSSPALA